MATRVKPMKPVDSFFIISVNQMFRNIKSDFDFMPYKKRVRRAVRNLEETAKQFTATADVVDNDGNVVGEAPNVSITNQVWNEHAMKFENTTSYGEFEYDNDPIIGAVKYEGNAMGVNFELTDDQLDNFLDDAVVDLKPKDKEEARLYKYCILTILGNTGKIRIPQLKTRCKDSEDIVLCNSIYTFFNDVPWFPGFNALEISEYMTKEQILKVMSYLNQKSMFDVDYAFAGYLRKAQIAYADEMKKIIGNNGNKPVSDDEIITPIIFNNAYLSSVDLLSGNVPEPKILPSLKKAIIEKVAQLTGIDPKAKEGLMIEVRGKVDPDNPISCVDLGQAVVNIKDIHTGFIQKQLLLDLDNITATGINVIVKAIDPMGNLCYLFAGLDKDKDIVKNILTSQQEYIVNANTEQGKKEYEQLCSRLLPNPAVYSFYDFSGMHKNIEGLTEKQAKTFCNLLMAVQNQPWYNLGNASLGAPFRFRFRDFKTHNEFTLISDKNVRVQDRTWMAKPIGNPYGKLYMDKPGVSTEDKLVVKVKKDSFTVTLNGEEIDWQNK